MAQELREKIYFSAGDIVKIKQEIADRPAMIVKSVDKLTLPKNAGAAAIAPGGLLGVTCFWFSADKKLQQARFSTKDLTKDI